MNIFEFYRRKGMIQEIDIEKLEIHPKNVRKVYTDIDELAESIKPGV